MKIIDKNLPLLKKIKKICKLYNIDIPFDNENLKIEYIDRYTAFIFLDIENISISWSYAYRTITQTYYKNGKIHNVNGPAIICKDNIGIRIVNYINGIYISEDITNKNPDILDNKILQKILF